jgi:proliferating cell nuclear antigen
LTSSDFQEVPIKSEPSRNWRALEMEARFEDPTTFRKVLDALRELVEEGNIDCNQSGLSMQAMDASHVALVSMHLNAKALDHFKCNQNITLGVNLASIQKILKCGDSKDVLTLKSSEETSELQFTMENSGRIFQFSMALMDIDSEHLAIPEADPEATITIPSSEFQRICKDLTQFGDSVKIQVTHKSVTFSVEGSTGKGSITLAMFDSTKGDKQIEITASSKVELSFALRYLNFFTKAAPLSDTVRLDLSADRPLMAVFELPDDAGSIRYYLAPKAEDEEGEGD